MKSFLNLTCMLLLLVGMHGSAQSQNSPPQAQRPQRMVIEIYRIAPGQHEAFLRLIAKVDEAQAKAGLPPRQLYVHVDGASWDFLMIQPAQPPPDKIDALRAAFKAAGISLSAKFFFEYRKYIAEHTDTFVEGPTTAKDYLASLEK